MMWLKNTFDKLYNLPVLVKGKPEPTVAGRLYEHLGYTGNPAVGDNDLLLLDAYVDEAYIQKSKDGWLACIEHDTAAHTGMHPSHRHHAVMEAFVRYLDYKNDGAYALPEHGNEWHENDLKAMRTYLAAKGEAQ